MFFVKHNSTRTQRQTSRAEACMQCRVLEEMNQSCRASVEQDRGTAVQVLFFSVSVYRMPALHSFIRKLSPRKRNKLIYPTELHLYILS